MTAGTIPEDSGDLAARAGTARDSMTLAAWTAISRASGVVRVIVIGAVLGPTIFGNAFQLTNSVPNLLFYGFLGGSLLSSLLVPALVHHIDRGDVRSTARVSGGFLGVEWIGLLLGAPVIVLGLPPLVAALSGGGDEQIGQVRMLLLLAVPQAFLYALIASATAVMYAERRYALAAAAPLVENVGVVTVLLLTAAVYGTDYADSGTVPMGAVLLLGLGSTGAVAIHAAVQWLGAHRGGVVLVPSRGWRDAEVRAVVRRAMRSISQAGLYSVQILLLLVLAARIPGGTVAMQISLNFFHVPLALAAAPVGLAVLPRLARLRDRPAEFADAYVGAVTLALFLVVPAACGYIVLAGPLAHTIAVGELATSSGIALVVGALATISVGLVGETLFFVSTQAAYARDDARLPLRSMMLQTVVCLALFALSFRVPDDKMVVALGGAFSAACLVGGLHLYWRLRATNGMRLPGLGRAVVRIAVAAAVMVVAVAGTARGAGALLDGRPGQLAAVVAGGVVGLLVYGAVHRLLGSPEVGLLTASLRRRGGAREDPEKVTLS